MKIINYIKQNYWLSGILILATVLRLYRLDFQSVWMDEIYTLNVSNPKLSWTELHDLVVQIEGFPYFYFLLLRGFYAVLGYSELVARLVSALGGIAGIYAIYRVGKELFSRNAGLISAFLLAISEFHIAYSQEARPYTLFLLFALIAFYRLSIFIKLPTLKNAVWYGLSAGLLLNINFFGFITMFSHAILLLLLILFSSKGYRLQVFKNSLLSGIIALLLFAPNYEILVKLLKYQSFWVPPPNEDSLGILYREFLGNFETTRIIFNLIFIYYIISLFRTNDTETTLSSVKGNVRNYSFIILFVWLVAYVAVILLKSYSGTSLMLGRYFVSVVPVFFLALGIGIDLIRNRIVKIAVICAILYFTMFNLFIGKRYYSTVSKSQYREVSAFIEENNNNNTPVYTSLKFWYDYFLDDEEIKTTLIEKPLEAHVAEMMQDSTKRVPFWYADAHNRPYQLSKPAEEYLNKYFYVESSFNGFDAWTRYYDIWNPDFKKFGALKEINGDSFNYNVDNYITEGNTAKVEGWAFFMNQPSTRTSINVVLIKDGEVHKFITQPVLRQDVMDYFKSHVDISNCGFSSTISFEGLKPGRYQVGLYLKNRITKKEGLTLTDKFVDIP